MISMNRGGIATLAFFALAACSSVPQLAPPAGSSGSSTAQAGGSGAGGTSAMTVADQAFLTHAAYGGLAEVALGQLAQQQGGSPDVRAFGQRMVVEHSRTNEELVALARSKGMTPPTAPDPGRQAAAAALGQLQGTNFDRQYIEHQLVEHQLAVAIYDAEARRGTDPQIRAFAAKWLPVLREHEQHVRTMGVPTASLTR